MSKPVYGKQAAQIRADAKDSGPVSGLVWALCLAFVLFLGWTPFQVGLFNGTRIEFDKPIYVAALISGLLLLFSIALSCKSFKLDGQLELLSVAAILLPLTYALSLINAASHYTAMNLLFIQFTYAAVFITSVYLLKQKQLNQLLQLAVLAVAYLIVGFGLLNWLGSWRLAGSLTGWFTDAVEGGRYSEAVMTDSNGLRLTSVFQYANTYAAFLMAFLFVALFALIRSRKWYGQLMHGFMLVPLIVSLLLTLSRGGLVLLPVVFILLLLFLKPVQQILWIIQLAVAGVLSLLITNPVTRLGLELNTAFTSAAALKGWAYLLGASACASAIALVIQRWLAPWLYRKLGSAETRRWSGLWIPVVSVAGVALIAFLLIGTSARNILPANIGTRLENINFRQHSVLERFTFYKDAMKVVKDYPVLGAGGGGWASLYEHYQNNPYVSRQVHNFFLQYLIEVGILGFLVCMGFILFIFYKYIKGYLKRRNDDYNNGFFYLIIALSILVHSLLDFNMSYAFMGILVFLSLGGMAVAMESKPLRLQWNKRWFRAGYFGLLGIATGYLLFLSLGYISSSSEAYKAKKLMGVSQSYEELKAPLVKALKNRPNHPESAAYLSLLDQKVFVQTQDVQFLDETYAVLTRALKDEPYNKDLLAQLVSYYDLRDQSDEAYRVYLDNAGKFNWDINWYDQLISRAALLGQKDNAHQDQAGKETYWGVALAAYQHVTDGIVHLQTLPPEQLQGREFFITPTIALNAGRVEYLSGQEEAALATLKKGFINGYEDLAEPGTHWGTDWYSAVISRSYDLGSAALKRAQEAYALGQNDLGDQETLTKQRYYRTGLDAYAHAVTNEELLSKQPDAGDLYQEPRVTAPIRLNAGKLQYMSGQLQAAADTLKSGLTEDYSDTVNREAARWYLAALQRKNAALDQAVYDKLIAADPEEAVKIGEITGMQL
ncbi:O-antigen ligase family protein [Paenibacillus sp. MMS20-IR301]|uniref:PglL family O-oligosaccharyltransferase n=1 Tax=Paenibacillus sp. MMS20-IR301 TaxID=2895946 RepID=UPI0028E935F5|nr:O-antigen ligase family protein [Paenibacillus sp. MMS20-IR301]WNS43312.1 O-antigen ligase family protein [Paenibacillus sp. MMS20-IR301]